MAALFHNFHIVRCWIWTLAIMNWIYKSILEFLFRSQQFRFNEVHHHKVYGWFCIKQKIILSYFFIAVIIQEIGKPYCFPWTQLHWQRNKKNKIELNPSKRPEILLTKLLQKKSRIAKSPSLKEKASSLKFLDFFFKIARQIKKGTPFLRKGLQIKTFFTPVEIFLWKL